MYWKKPGRFFMHLEKVTNRHNGTFADHNTSVAHRLRFLVAGWQHMFVAAMEGSPVHQDGIWLVRATNNRRYFPFDFLENNIVRFHKKKTLLQVDDKNIELCAPICTARSSMIEL